MERYDPANLTKSMNELIAKTTNPLQEAIIRNYRRHVLLEVSGQWEDIFTPEMTVEEPYYRLTFEGTTRVLEGAEEVKGFYRELAASGLASLWGPVHPGLITVDDWGVATLDLLGEQLTGHELAARGEEVDDLDAHYYFTSSVASIWLYDDRARLISEQGWQDLGSRSFVKMDPEDVWTVEYSRERLAPLLETDLEPVAIPATA